MAKLIDMVFQRTHWQGSITMFERIARGWGIAKASWGVLKQHPKLLLLPIFSGIAFLVLMGIIWGSVFAGSKSAQLQQLFSGVENGEPLVYALLFVLYFVSTFIVIFFNAALIFCAMQCFAGKEPSIRAGLATAMGRLPQILAWTLVASTVGLLLSAVQNFLKDRLGFLGSLLGGLLETGWVVVTYFVVPVVVVDGVGPIEAVKRSSSILKRTWGESLGGEGGLGIISFLLFLPVVLVIGLVAMVGRGLNADVAVIVTLAAIVVPYILALTLVFTALGTIFRTGTYIYATTGKAPAQMDASLMQGAFKPKS